MQKYNLGYIIDEDLFHHVKDDDVVDSLEQENIENSVFEELSEISPNLLKSLYLLSFSKYEGFDSFHI